MGTELRPWWVVFLISGCALASGAAERVAVDEGLAGSYMEVLSGVDGGDDSLAVWLYEPLSEEQAVRVALSASGRMRTLTAELDIAQAQRSERVRTDDPVLGGAVRTAEWGRVAELELHQDLTQWILRAARVDLGAIEYGAARQRIADRLLTRVTGVRVAYYELLRTHHQVVALRLSVEAAAAAYDLAQTLYRAGNLSELETVKRQSLYEDARLELAQGEAAEVVDREQLNALMGLWGGQIEWRLPAQLPPLPEKKIALEDIESRAVAHRADLLAAQIEREARTRALEIARSERWFGGIEVGLSAEWEGGDWAVGPAAGIRLPFFGGAEVERRRGELRRSEHALVARAVEVRAEVRAGREKLLAAQERARHYRDTVLPLKERIVALVQQQYNFMLDGPFELLAARQAEIAAERDHIAALGDYWIARVELEAAVGTKLEYERGDH